LRGRAADARARWRREARDRLPGGTTRGAEADKTAQIERAWAEAPSKVGSSRYV